MTLILDPDDPAGWREAPPASAAPSATMPAAAGDRLTDGLNPEQREAVEYRGQALLIVAGAGSGKTRVLTYRVAHLLAACGVEIVQASKDARGRPSLEAVLKTLAERGINSLLVEGGASVHAAFLDRDLADRLEVFRAPIVLGGGGHNSIDALAALGLEEAPRFVGEFRHNAGPDLVESFVREA